MASVAPDAPLQTRLSAAPNAAKSVSAYDALNTPTSEPVAEPAQKALSTPPGDTLVFMDTPKDPAKASEAGHSPSPIEGNATRFAMLLVLVFGLLGVALAVAHFMKKGTGKKGDLGPRLELVDSLRIGGKWHISLVRAPGRLLVIGASEGEVSLLADLDEDEEHEGLLADTLVDMPSMTRAQRTHEPAPVQAPPEPSLVPAQDHAEEDPFFDALLERMNTRQPNMVRSAPRPTVVEESTAVAMDSSIDEMAAIRARIAAYERRNAQMA
jgi:flagellar biogenesis protein FliO